MKKGFSLLEILVSALLLNLGIYLSMQVHQHSLLIEKRHKQEKEKFLLQIATLDSLVKVQPLCKSETIEKESLDFHIEPVSVNPPFVRVDVKGKTLWRIIPCKI